MRHQTRLLSGFLCTLCLLMGQPPARAETVTVLDWNIMYGYGDSGGAPEYLALKRIVQAMNPQVILLQEATDDDGRAQFIADFGELYPYGFQGAPATGNPRNQIWSAYPLVSFGEIYTWDQAYERNFERPTIWADLDILPEQPGSELRVYCAHYKAGTEARDSTLRLGQATDDSDHVVAHLGAHPGARIYYAGDLNAEPAQAPLVKLQESRTTLARLGIVDPNTFTSGTRISGRVIDHLLRSSSLIGFVSDAYIFHTETYFPAEPPPPAQEHDTQTASDHFTLMATLDIRPIMINEVFAHQTGTSDRSEFIELYGGQALAGFSIVIIEGDSAENPGRVDALWSLNGRSIPISGYFVLGDSDLGPDLSIGLEDVLENGTQTILLIQNCTLSVGEDLDTDDDGNPEATGIGTVFDGIALSRGIGSDRTYYGATVFSAPGDGVPPGACRWPNAVDNGSTTDWVTLSLLTDGRDGGAPITPRAANAHMTTDIDADGDVDTQDVNAFISCLSGSGGPIGGGCSPANIDGDSDVDQVDFAIFQQRLTGPR